MLGGEPLFACKYHMAKGHWQIYLHSDNGKSKAGLVDTIPIYQVPQQVLKTAVKATSLIGKGLYGVDLKVVNGKAGRYRDKRQSQHRPRHRGRYPRR